MLLLPTCGLPVSRKEPAVTYRTSPGLGIDTGGRPKAPLKALVNLTNSVKRRVSSRGADKGVPKVPRLKGGITGGGADEGLPNEGLPKM